MAFWGLLAFVTFAICCSPAAPLVIKPGEAAIVASSHQEAEASSTASTETSPLGRDLVELGRRWVPQHDPFPPGVKLEDLADTGRFRGRMRVEQRPGQVEDDPLRWYALPLGHRPDPFRHFFLPPAGFEHVHSDGDSDSAQHLGYVLHPPPSPNTLTQWFQDSVASRPTFELSRAPRQGRAASPQLRASGAPSPARRANVSRNRESDGRRRTQARASGQRGAALRRSRLAQSSSVTDGGHSRSVSEASDSEASSSSSHSGRRGPVPAPRQPSSLGTGRQGQMDIDLNLPPSAEHSP